LFQAKFDGKANARCEIEGNPWSMSHWLAGQRWSCYAWERLQMSTLNGANH